jgi:hypothetical protein
VRFTQNISIFLERVKVIKLFAILLKIGLRDGFSHVCEIPWKKGSLSALAFYSGSPQWSRCWLRGSVGQSQIVGLAQAGAFLVDGIDVGDRAGHAAAQDALLDAAKRPTETSNKIYTIPIIPNGSIEPSAAIPGVL